MAITYADILRYNAKVIRKGPSECWPWDKSLNKYGYGQFRWSGTVNTAHRFGWEKAYGPIPPGLEVDHRCRNPICQNPAHFQLLTKAQNAALGNKNRKLGKRILSVAA